jgi:hypothetical protein
VVSEASVEEAEASAVVAEVATSEEVPSEVVELLHAGKQQRIY